MCFGYLYRLLLSWTRKKQETLRIVLSSFIRRWFLIFGTRPRKIPGNILNRRWLLISLIRQRRRLGNILFWIVVVPDFWNKTKKNTRRHFRLSLTSHILYQIENISWWITAGGCARWRPWVAHSPACGTFICLLVCLEYHSFDIWKIICLFGRSYACLFGRSFVCFFGRSFFWRSFVCFCLQGNLNTCLFV